MRKRLSPELLYQALQRCEQRLGIEASSSECMELELHLRYSVRGRERKLRKENVVEKKEKKI